MLSLTAEHFLGASVAEWLRFPTENHLPLTAVSSRPTRVKIFHVRKLTS